MTTTTPHPTATTELSPNFVRWILPVFYTVLGILVALILWFNIWQPITVLPRIIPSPGFVLTDQTGERVISEALRGQITLYSFGVSDCTSCNQPLTDLAAVEAVLSNQLADDVPFSLVTVGLDGAYPSSSEDEPLSWTWLTGEDYQVRSIVGGGFNLYYDADETGVIRYEPRFILVDGLGMVRAYYHTAAPDSDLLVRDINLLWEEAQNSTGAGQIAYEAAHLFLCYPR